MVAAAVVGSAVVGGVMQAGAASDAADAQRQGAEQANATQRYMYDTTRADNAPFLQTGTAANQRLSYLLGLGGQGAPMTSAPTRDQFAKSTDNVTQAYRDLLGRDPESGGYEYYKAKLANGWTEADLRNDIANSQEAKSLGGNVQYKPSDAENASIDQQYQNALSAYSKQQTQGPDPSYGSLLSKFTQNDLNNDVVYQNGLQFGLSEGEKGINNQAAATGSYLSGATLKALTKYGNDYGTTKANDAYNRFNNDKQSTFNMLSGISGTGQVASNAVGSAGQNYANQVSNNQTALGNARGASAIAGANGVTNALSSGVNGLQTNNLINSLGNRKAIGSGYGSSFGTSGLDGSLNDYPTYVS